MGTGQKFLSALTSKARFFSGGPRQVFQTSPELVSWLLDPLAQWAETAYGNTIFEKAAKGYVEFCINVAKAQKLYEESGQFNSQEFRQIKAEIYEEDGYMTPYMWAAILIYAFWPSMVNHIRLYRDDFIFQLSQGAKVLELASGHGVMGLLAAQSRSDIHIKGFDISPPAVAIANRLKSASLLGDRVTFEVKNALDLEKAGEKGTYQGVIAAMLAEHLTDPRPLFATIAHHLAPGGIAFFSTAIESAQPDHIFEFNYESEPLVMAEEVGLRVIRLVSDGSMDSNPNQRYQPRAIAMILMHK